MIPEELKDYKGIFIVETSMEGGFGTVYILYHKDNPSIKMAIKHIPMNMFSNHNQTNLFIKECISSISILPHPNIVNYTDFERTHSGYFLEQEYAGKKTLRSFIKGSEHIGISKILHLAMQFCDGMIFLNDNYGIIHGDIKPENIIISDNGDLKIADFGLSTMNEDLINQLEKAINKYLKNKTKKSIDYHPIKSMNEIIPKYGTVPYLAPELLKGNKHSHTSDIYAFGLVLYELFFQKLPFTFENESELIDNILSHEVLISNEIPDVLQRIILKCIDKLPDRRYQSFKELRNELKTYCMNNSFSNSITKEITIKDVENSIKSIEWSNRGFVFKRFGLNEKALRCYKKAIENQTDLSFLALTYCNLGSLYIATDEYEDATKCFKKAINLEAKLSKIELEQATPVRLAVRKQLAQIEWLKGNKYRAIELMENLITEHNDMGSFARYLLYWYIELNDSKYEILLNKMLKQSDDIIIFHLGITLDQNYYKTELAIKCFKVLIHRNSKNYKAHFNLGIAHDRNHQNELAKENYQESIKIQETFAPPYFYLGIYYFIHDDTIKCVNCIKQFNKLNTKSNDETTIFINVIFSMLQKRNRPDSVLIQLLNDPRLRKYIG